MAGTNQEPTRFEAVLMKTTSAESYDESSITNIGFLRTSIPKPQFFKRWIHCDSIQGMKHCPVDEQKQNEMSSLRG